MNWKQKIEYLMLERGWNQSDLADASGYGQSHISKLLNRSTPPSNKTLTQLAQAFDVPVESFTETLTTKHNRIPLLKPDQILLWLNTPDTLVDKVNEWFPACLECSKKSYALAVSSNDMYNSGSSVTQYPLNALIIVDPEKNRKTGSRIICQLPDQRIIFRELQESAGEYYLAPLNPSFPMISLGSEFHARYLGSVIATLIKEPA